MLTGKERVYLVGGGRSYDISIDEIAAFLSQAGVQVTVADISDAGATGSQVLSAVTPAAAQTALGAGATGSQVFTSANQAALLSVIGNAAPAQVGLVLRAVTVGVQGSITVAGTDVPTTVTSTNAAVAQLVTKINQIRTALINAGIMAAS